MRATTRRRVGAGLLLAWVVLLGAVAWTSLDDHGRVERPEPASAAARFVDAYERSRTATFLTIGTFSRRSEVTGAEIASEDVVAQRPPRRLHRQLGGLDGRDDDRPLVCQPIPSGSEEADCELGPPGGATYAEDVARAIASLRTLVDGPEAIYSVTADGPGCFALEQRRPALLLPFGLRSRHCFDRATGAPIETAITYAGGIEERTAVERVRAEVDDDDLAP